MIRPATPDDAAEIIRIYNPYILHDTATFEIEPLTTDEMRRRISTLSAHFPYLVWEDDTCHKIYGFCYAHSWKPRPAYCQTAETTIYVDKECRQSGVGTALMRQLIEACRQMGLHMLVACISADNTASCRFHEKLGFTRVSLFPEVGNKFGKWIGVTDYLLNISPGATPDSHRP